MLGLQIDPPVLFTSGASVSAVYRTGLKIGSLVHTGVSPQFLYTYYKAYLQWFICDIFMESGQLQHRIDSNSALLARISQPSG
jgi:hypothetical protein